MASFVDKLIEKQVSLLTNDGRTFTGLLKSLDQRMNLIVADCKEQVYTCEGVPMQEEDMGVYFIRGDNIAVIGQVDPYEEQKLIDICALTGPPLPAMQIH